MIAGTLEVQTIWEKGGTLAIGCLLLFLFFYLYLKKLDWGVGGSLGPFQLRRPCIMIANSSNVIWHRKTTILFSCNLFFQLVPNIFWNLHFWNHFIIPKLLPIFLDSYLCQFKKIGNFLRIYSYPAGHGKSHSLMLKSHLF